jgi:hypothetical protein
MNQIQIETNENFTQFLNNLKKQPKQQWEQYVADFLIKYGVNIRAFNILMIVTTNNAVYIYPYYYNVTIELKPGKNGNIVISL